jgi:hypothetical protein
MRCQECLAARGGPAVDSNLNQGFFDLIDRYTAGNRGIRVNAQLLKAAEPCEDSKRQDTDDHQLELWLKREEVTPHEARRNRIPARQLLDAAFGPSAALFSLARGYEPRARPFCFFTLIEPWASPAFVRRVVLNLSWREHQWKNQWSPLLRICSPSGERGSPYGLNEKTSWPPLWVIART